MWNRLKARWQAHDKVMLTRELRREAVEVEGLEAGHDPLPHITTPYLDQPVQPSTGFTHPEQRED
jgi:hypothetical protein